eukprot:m51a1_g7722 hypothetical protein (229) ;mRNA; f:147453-148269
MESPHRSRPHTVFHVAASADGCTDFPEIDIQTYYATAARAWPGAASLTGADTLVVASRRFALPTDDPHDPAPAPACAPSSPGSGPLVVIDTKASETRPHWSSCASVCTERTPAEHVAYLRSLGVAPVVVPETPAGFCDLRAALDEVERRFAPATVRVDSGGTLAGALLAAGILDEVSVQVAPVLVCAGGTQFAWAKSAGTGVGRPALSLKSCERLGDIVWLRYDVRGS